MYCINCGKQLPDDAAFCVEVCASSATGFIEIRTTSTRALSSLGLPAQPEPPVRRLACPSCGGMLPLPKGDAEFMQCSYCNTSLQIRRSATKIIFERSPWETCEVSYSITLSAPNPNNSICFLLLMRLALKALI